MSKEASFRIKNFKCFDDIKMPIRQLSVFAGGNGNGKSSTIQALLLLRSYIEKFGNIDAQKAEYNMVDDRKTGIGLNDTYTLSLGSCEYIIPRDSDSSVMDFFFMDDTSSFGVTFNATGANLYIEPIKTIENGKVTSLFKQSFYYLNAERLGPRIKQDIRYTDFPHVGYKGEYTAQLLGDTNFNYSHKVDDNRKHPTTTSPRLAQQVSAWLDELMPGVSVDANYNVETMSAQISVNNQFTKGNSVLTPNIGFGISYVLPIIVTGLIAEKGSFFIVENPEAHLHPSAQSKIGEFLTKIASAGVYVIIETHSDHVLNGIQIKVAKNEIDPKDVVVNFLSQIQEEDQPYLDSIEINAKGELNMWPKGFFDQSQTDFARLFNLRRNTNHE